MEKKGRHVKIVPGLMIREIQLKDWKSNWEKLYERIMQNRVSYKVDNE